MSTTTTGTPIAMRCVFAGLGAFFTAITAKVLLADVTTITALKTDHLLTIGALVGAVVAGVFFGPLLMRGKVIAAVGLGLSFCAATGYCLIGSAGRGDELAFEQNAEARKTNETRARYMRDRDEAKRRWETAQEAEATECASGEGTRCKGRRSTTAQARSTFEVTDLLVRQAGAEARENGKLKRAAELWALARGGDVKDAEKALALLWPFLPPAICELLSIIFWHQALARRHRFAWQLPRWQWRPLPDTLALPPPFPVSQPVSTVSEAVSEPKKPTAAYYKAKKQRPTDVQLVLTALEKAGRPVCNDELAELLGCTKGESSKRVANCGDAVDVRKNGRYLAITPNYHML